MNVIKYLFNLPSLVIGSFFPPKIQRVTQLVVISPDMEALHNMANTIGKHDDVLFATNHRIVIGSHKVYLGDSEVAFVMLRKRKWINRPAVTVAIIHK